MAKDKTTKTEKPVDDEGQVTPTGDALSESEVVGSSAGAGTSLADIAAAFRAAGVSAARSEADRAFSRDQIDSDIGYEEGLKYLLLRMFTRGQALSDVLDHAKAIKSLNVEETQHERNSDNAFYSGVQKSDSTFHSGLLKAYGLETDNEVISTVALAKMLENLNNRMVSIEEAIANAG